jgi:hypothetical protein
MKFKDVSYEITVIDMYDHDSSYTMPPVTQRLEALTIATKTVLDSVDWSSKECKYKQWAMFGEDATIRASNPRKAITFSGDELVRRRCKCLECKAYLADNHPSEG